MKHIIQLLIPLSFFGVVSQTAIFSQGSDSLYTLNDGSFTQGTGSFVRSGDDQVQGVVANFTPISLNDVGDFVQATFTWSGGSSNNSGQNINFGFFSGDAVTGNAQTSVTDDWEGYFSSHGARTGNATPNGAYGVYRQGEGTQPLMDRTSWTGGTSNAAVNGAGGNVGSSGLRAGFNHPITNTEITLNLTRISETQLMLTTIYPTGRQDGTHSATLGGIPYTMNVVSGIATTTATFLAADGPTSINGIALAARQNFTLTNLEITAIPEPGTLAMLALGLGALIHFRRRRQ